MVHRHILVVDDEPCFRFSVELALRKKGYMVSEAFDGKDAMEAILASCEGPAPFDLILLDLDLPILSGTEILRELDKRGIELPVMVISGCIDPDTYQELMQLHCLDIMFKPVSEQILLKRVDELARHWPQ